MNHASPLHRNPGAGIKAPLAWLAPVLLGALLGTPQLAQAGPIDNGDGSYTFNFEINAGDTPPAGDPWWLSALISPLAGDSGVTIDLISNLQDPNEFITSVGFNLINPISNFSWSCSSADITCSDSSVAQVDDITTNLPEFQFSNGIQGLDLAIRLPESNKPGIDRFQGDDTARFTINGTGLTPLNFLTTNIPSGPVSGIYSAARVQGLQTGSGSTTITDPDPESAPGPLPLLGAGVALGFSRRLRQRLAVGQE
ncbi:MAG: hypothetical protein ACO289_06915, partial [Prochlorococcaceae cyanobacterium]